MAELTRNSEVDRIRETYRNYSEDEAVRDRWAAGNSGNQAILRERDAAIEVALHEKGFLPLTERKVLDVGCGHGYQLAKFQALGAKPENLYGIDLIPSRIEIARKAHPFYKLLCENAENMEFPVHTFDLVTLFTVLSSVLDDGMAQALTTQVRRVLKPGGAVLWYDFRYNNPKNLNTRGMTKKHLENYFPGYKREIKSITLLPPLARRLGTFTPFLYPMLSRLRVLRTHYLALLVKPFQENHK